jgi:hypothetical protein
MKLVKLAITLIALQAGSTAAAAGDGIMSTTLLEEDKVFTNVMGPINFADAFGSREAGPHGTFGQFPANFETPEHTHSHGYRAVVLKGQMTNPFEGQMDAPVMSPGSYWAVTAGQAHSTACVSDTACEFFMFSQDGFDFAPTE